MRTRARQLGLSLALSLGLACAGRVEVPRLTPGEAPKEAGELRVLAYNLFLRPRVLPDGQLERAALLPVHLRGYDVLILSEVFEARTRRMLIEALRAEYPYFTSPLGGDRYHRQDGGVLIASRWPIELERQRLFGEACAGSDCLARKGVLYVRLNKLGRTYHLFGTHTQAWGTRRARAARLKQLRILREFIEAQKIPAEEPVIIGGDLNVDRANLPAEYQKMLEILRAEPAEQAPGDGPRYTYDPEQNGLARGWRSRGAFLDYVFYSRTHLRPRRATLEVRIFRASEGWRASLLRRPRVDLSDHYAVAATFYFP